MSKYPKAWLDAAKPVVIGDDPEMRSIVTRSEYEILDALAKVGALKELPNPREWCFCVFHCRAVPLGVDDKCLDGIKGNPKLCNMIRVREVIDE